MDDLIPPPSPSTPAATATMTYPLVTVALVAHNPGAWFEEVLRSISAQDYPALDLVVVDAASEPPLTDRVHAVVPEATIMPLVANVGFGANANVILEHEAMGPYVLVCHDDVALAPDCVRRLVEETLRSNAGIVGPKLLDWNDENRILHVGLGADKIGQVSDLAEPGEYDQEQHDAVRDVFAVPGAVTLIRSDLFVALGGFDDEMVVRGEDLDLCWRAHALGARVIVNPAATARHREDLSTRITGRDSDRYVRRHRIRSMLSNYGTWHTLRVLPQALGSSFINIVLALLQGRVSLIFEIVGAWTWNLTRFASIRRRRRHLRSIRQVEDAEVRALQVPGFEGLASWRRDRADRQFERDRDATVESAAQAAERTRALQISLAVWGAVIGVILFGSRSLISEGLPLFNEFVKFPNGPSPLLTEWSSTWRSTGVGAEAPSSLLHALLGFVGVAAFGQMGLVRLVVTVGLIFVGLAGAYRLAAPFRGWEAPLVALVVYAAVPLPYNALYEGSWSALAAYAATPWVAKRMAMAASIPPFDDDEPTWLRRVADVGGVALILAVAGLIDPVLVALPVILVFGWALGSLATRRVRGIGRLLLVMLGSMVGAFVLLMPASIGLLQRNAAWSTFSGAASVSPDRLNLTDLGRLATGPHGDSWFGWVLLVVPALALVMASGNRFAWAVRSWCVVCASLALALVAQRGVFGVSLPSATVLLAPMAASLAMGAAMTTVAFRNDLRRYRFGWRQLVPFVAAAALFLSSLAGLAGSADGRWQVVKSGYEDVFSFLDEQTPGNTRTLRAPAHSRALWLGDDDVLPVTGWRFDDEIAFGLTQARVPTVLDHSIGNPDRTVENVRAAVDRTLSGTSNRLGEQLARYGILWVIVVEADAPVPFTGVERQVDPVLMSRLAEQLDLVRIEVRAGASIFLNQSFVPTVASLPPGTLANAELVGSPFELALPEVRSLRSYSGALPVGDLSVAVPSDTNWTLTVAQQQVPKLANDWSTGFTVATAGGAQLDHSNHASYWVGALVQLIGWVGLGTVLVLGRRRRR